DQLAELEDILVGRLSKFGITDARVRRDPATQEADVPDGQVMNKDVGQVERDLLVLAADFAQSDKLTASLRFSDGQWLNFTEPITPAGPILSWDSLPLYSLIAGLIIVMSIWSLRRLTAPYRMMETAVNRIGKDLKSPPIAETGSREIRAAAKAVNAMHIVAQAHLHGVD
ncbi:MAG: HAMP domain-containing protein, partial [Mesorhizobium sp.]